MYDNAKCHTCVSEVWREIMCKKQYFLKSPQIIQNSDFQRGIRHFVFL